MRDNSYYNSAASDEENNCRVFEEGIARRAQQCELCEEHIQAKRSCFYEVGGEEACRHVGCHLNPPREAETLSDEDDEEEEEEYEDGMESDSGDSQYDDTICQGSSCEEPGADEYYLDEDYEDEYDDENDMDRTWTSAPDPSSRDYVSH